jgi:ATP-dependent Clp protease ATP-binding subunit ClpA
VEKGYDPTYGARPMRRAVERFLEDPLAEEILKGRPNHFCQKLDVDCQRKDRSDLHFTPS